MRDSEKTNCHHEGSIFMSKKSRISFEIKIKYAQNYLEPFDLAGNEMSFFKPRTESFPLLKYAYECAKKGNSYPIAFNASNEIAVQAFIEKKCSFRQLAQITELTLQKDWSAVPLSVNDVFEADKLARKTARRILLSVNGGF